MNKAKVWLVAAMLSSSVAFGARGAGADDGADLAALRERVARLEEKAARQEKLEAEVAKGSAVLLALEVGAPLYAVLLALVNVILWLTIKGKKEELVEKIAAKVSGEATMTRLFDAQKADLVKRVLARDRAIALIGKADRESVKSGEERLEKKEGIIERLNEISVAIPANTPMTAAHEAREVTSLGARRSSVNVSGKRSVGDGARF